MIRDIIRPDRTTSVVDVGARPIDGPPSYLAMHEAGLCRLTAFDPCFGDDDFRINATMHPKVIGDGNPASLHEYEACGLNGLLHIDRARIKCLSNFTMLAQAKGSEDIATNRLDDAMEGPMDFLKIDAQGAELMVFEGAERLLENAVAVQTEVSFFQIYEDQPTFGDIDRDLRVRGFIPHRFMEMKNWMIAPLTQPGHPFACCNQLLEADIVYVRDFTRMHLFEREQLQHLAMLAHYVFQSPDLVVRCISEMIRRAMLGQDAIGSYLEIIN